MRTVNTYIGSPIERIVGRGSPSNGFNLGPHVGFVTGKRTRQLGDLAGNDSADGKNDQKRQQHDADD